MTRRVVVLVGVVVVLAVLLATPAEAKRRHDRHKDKDAKCEKAKWKLDSTKNRDLVCAACRYLTHEVQVNARLNIRKHHSQKQKAEYTAEAIDQTCGLVASRRMAQMGERPNREYINWLEKIGRGMEEVTGMLCMGPEAQQYIDDACLYFMSTYREHMLGILSRKKFKDLGKGICEELAGVCDPIEDEETHVHDEKDEL